MAENPIIVQLRDKLKRSFGPHYHTCPITALTGDASDRKYFRVKSDSSPYAQSNKSHAHHPSLNTQIICWDNQNESLDNFLSVQNYLYQHHIPVPKVYASNKSENLIILQDLTDVTLAQLLDSSGPLKISFVEMIYRKVIDSLILMQKLSVPSQHYAFNSSFFNNEKFLYEVGVSLEYFVLQYKGRQLSDRDQEQTKTVFRKLLSGFEQGSYVFVHRDFHSRNIMSNNNQLYFIDFQDARLGPIYYDLVSLLDDCYFQIDETEKKILLKYYFDSFVALHLPYLTFDSFLKNYYLMAIQRIFKALGSFAFLSIVKSKKEYLQYIPPNEEKLIRYIDQVVSGQDKLQLLGLFK